MTATSPARRCLLLLVLLAAFPATHPAAATAAPPKPPSKKEEAALLAAPEADRISADHLAPAVRQAVANGIGSLLARITAEGNDHGLAFPPTQTMKVLEIVEVPAKRVQREHPIYEYDYATVEKIVPVLESGQPTGRFQTVKERVVVKRRQVGKKMVDHLVPDPDGQETIKRPKYGPGGPAGWTANLPGLNGRASSSSRRPGWAAIRRPSPMPRPWPRTAPAAAFPTAPSTSPGWPPGSWRSVPIHRTPVWPTRC